MSQIRTEIEQIFNNKSVGDLYSNSYGGDDMIYIEIERKFTFKEINDFFDIINQPIYYSFLSRNESSQGLIDFFHKFKKDVKNYILYMRIRKRLNILMKC